MSETRLHRGDTVPHVEVETVTGEKFNYTTIWQRKPLVLVALGTSSADESYGSDLSARAAEFSGRDTECVITRDDVGGLRTPGVLIADRWGEVVHVAEAASCAQLPSCDELIEWIEYVRRRCPECEGEAR